MKALSIKRTDKNKQMKVTLMLITLIVVLLAAVWVVQNKINIKPKALGPVCVNSPQCFFQPRPDWENITKYTIKLYEDGILLQTLNMTQQETKDQVNNEGYVVIDFPSSHQGSTYKCQVEVENKCGKTINENSDICTLPESTPTTAPTTTPPSLSPTPSVSLTPTPTITPGGPTLTPSPTITPGGPTLTPTPTVTPGGPILTPTVTPSGPTSTPSPTITPGGPTLTPSPTPTDIIIVKATNTPTPGGPTSAQGSTPTTTGITQIPSVGFITPTLIILFIGVIAILIPLFI